MSKALVFWFTGLSGSGKSTVADNVKDKCEALGIRTLTLDGDDVRTRLHKHLGFTTPEIIENNRLISELCVKFQPDYDVILVPIISPYRESRKMARAKIGVNFFEVYCAASLAVVQRRDTKGLYGMAKAGKMDNLIGYSPGSPYEPPLNPDLFIATGEENIEASVGAMMKVIEQKLGVKVTSP